MITGLKFVDKDGLFLSPEKCKKMFTIADEHKFAYPDYTATGKLELDHKAYRSHIDAILALDYIKPEQIRAKKFRVCLDAVNGTFSSSSGILEHQLIDCVQVLAVQL